MARTLYEKIKESCKLNLYDQRNDHRFPAMLLSYPTTDRSSNHLSKNGEPALEVCVAWLSERVDVSSNTKGQFGERSEWMDVFEQLVQLRADPFGLRTETVELLNLFVREFRKVELLSFCGFEFLLNLVNVILGSKFIGV